MGLLENYSIQALNLLEGLIIEYEETMKNIRRDDVTLKELKKLRFTINNRIRKISDIAEIKNEIHENRFKIIVFNSDYNEFISSELDELKLSYNIDGQFILVKKPNYNYNQLMTIVDDIEKKKKKFYQNVLKQN